MRAFAISMLTMFLLVAAPALAMLDAAAKDETDQTIGAAIPEPGALLLFAAGATLVFWVLRRRRATS